MNTESNLSNLNRNYLNYHNHNARNNLSYKDIKLSFHSIERARERLQLTDEKQIKKLASSAKKNGISLDKLTEERAKLLGIEGNLYDSLVRFKNNKGRFRDFQFPTYKKGKESTYFYKNCFFIFGGKKDKTLITIIKNESNINEGNINEENEVL